MNLSALKDLKYAKKYLKNCIINTHSYPALYIVLSGEVGEYTGYRKQNQQLISKYGTGEYFGESALFFNIKAKNEFIALTDVIAIAVSRAQAADFIRDEPGFAFELMKEFYGKQTGIAPQAETTAPPLSESVQSAVVPGQPEPDDVVAPAAVVAPAKPAKPVASAGPAQPAHAADPAPAVEKKKDRAPQAAQSAPAEKSVTALFPEGHKRYELSMNNQDRDHLLQKKCVCPLCNREFNMLRVREAKLVHQDTDRDMRTRYKNIEPLYYGVVTCPSCHYSALEEMFGHPDKPGRAKLPEGFDALTGPDYKFGLEMDADSVFAGYYLALHCAPHCFARYQMAQAKLLYRLHQIYKDAGDADMEMQTAGKALDAYQYIYLNLDVPANQDQQLCTLMGELTLKLGDPKSAKEYFFKARMNKQGTPLLQRHAEDRLYDIKEMETDSKT